MSLAPRLDRLDKNFLINGGFDYYQRGGVGASTNTAPTSLYVGPDRWRLMFAGSFTGTPNVIRSTTAPDNSVRYSNRWNFQRNASTGVLTYEQRIESMNCYEFFQAGKMSLSFAINSTIAPVGAEVRMYILTTNVIDDFTSLTTNASKIVSITSANTWQNISFEDITTTSTMLNGVAVRIEIAYPSGTDASAQFVLLTKAMLNCGSTASTFSRFSRTIAEELLSCQRYYEKSYNVDITPATVDSSGAVADVSIGTGIGHVSIPIFFKAPKRLPGNYTITFYNPATGATGSMDRGGTSIAAAADVRGQNSFRAYNNAGTSALLFHAVNYTVDSEL